MGVYIFRCLGAAVPEVVGNDPDRKPGIYQKRCRGVPVRYNYDKPENPVFMVV